MLHRDSRERKRSLGAYYTPDRLSAIVAQWAIERPDDRVLEPGFGGCGFLTAAKQRLEKLGQIIPHEYIHGCDVDEAAFYHLKEIFGASASEQHFPKIDFLETRPGKTWNGEKFQVALGNPPYVAYQALEQREKYQALMKSFGWGGLSARASLWAYFVLHALNFLEEGGRVAWVLPGSLLRANYAKFVKQVIATRFSRVALFHVHDRLFSPVGAEEETVVLCASDFRKEDLSEAVLSEYFVENVDDLSLAINSWKIEINSQVVSATQSARLVVDSLKALTTISLGELLTARIGLVTGDNKYFLFSSDRAAKERIDLQELSPVLTKGAMALGLSFGVKDLEKARDVGFSCYLLSSPTMPAEDERVNSYLESYPKSQIENISTYKKRARWYEPLDKKIPDAFWPVMRDLGPKIVLNPQRWHCTNTLHRIFFADHVDEVQQQLISVLLLSSFSQIYAELCGRSYGSGVLKHEPRDVENIRIPWGLNLDPEPVREAFEEIDKAMRVGLNSEATEIADNYVANHLCHLYTSQYRKLLQSTLSSLRKMRLPPKRI